MGSAGSGSPQDVTVVIIGAGVAGIATAVHLNRRGIDDFVVLEMSDGPGGTWWDNRYPGVEVDVPSTLYSFSFARHVFTRTHASGPELRDYIATVIDEQRIAGHFRYGCKVDRVEWQAETNRYTVTTPKGSYSARYVVSCVGQLNNPGTPSWAVDSPFQGELFHTARWDPSATLDGKAIAIVGTGSTSAQVIPELAKVARHVHVFQRQPGWVYPKPAHDYSERERRELSSKPWRMRLQRARTFLWVERMTLAARVGTRANRRSQRAAVEYLTKSILDPQLRAALTPAYPVGFKRPVLTSEYLPALQRDNVTLIPRAVQRLSAKGVVDASGQETEVDAVILATGFQPSRFLATFEVFGRDGRSIRDEWDDAPKSFLGMMATSFPNFFVTYGPNTNGGCLTFVLERQAAWIVGAISGAERRNVVLDIRDSAVRACDRLVTRGTARMVAEKFGHNYYTSRSGRVVTQWPYTQSLYWLLAVVFPARLVCRTTRRERV